MQSAEILPPPAAVIERLTFTQQQLCEALNISATTAWRLEKRGVLKPLPGLSRHKLYPASLVRRLAEKGAEAVA